MVPRQIWGGPDKYLTVFDSRLFAVGILAAMCGAGCSASRGAPNPDATPDGPVDGAASCTPLVASACSGGTGAVCQPTWTDVLASSACARPGIDRRTDCGLYHVRAVSNGGDSVAYYYYDAATGQLVAIYPPQGLDSCVAVSPAGVTTACAPAQLSGFSDVCLPDGGTASGENGAPTRLTGLSSAA